MADYTILKFNNISEKGLERLSDFNVTSESNNPDAIILRSYNLHDYPFDENLLAIGRAGAGVNNIPIDQLSERGVAVFNTPGANANAVKELVISAMLLSARNLLPAYDFVKELSGTDEEISKETEAKKKQFAGFELQGKTVGVVGLGAIGVKVANAAWNLGMEVIGYDPAIAIKNALNLYPQVKLANNIAEVHSKADFLTFHVPFTENTCGLLSVKDLSNLKDSVTILNFSRHGIVDKQVISEGIKSGKIRAYINDFPIQEFKDNPHVVALPHLGASTKEAEENCAIMICEQIKDYLLTGNVNNSKNLPNVYMARKEGKRLCIINKNVPNMLAEISGKLGAAGINIVDMINKSKGDLAYTIVDIKNNLNDEIIGYLSKVEGIIRIRVV